MRIRGRRKEVDPAKPVHPNPARRQPHPTPTPSPLPAQPPHHGLPPPAAQMPLPPSRARHDSRRRNRTIPAAAAGAAHPSGHHRIPAHATRGPQQRRDRAAAVPTRPVPRRALGRHAVRRDPRVRVGRGDRPQGAVPARDRHGELCRAGPALGALGRRVSGYGIW